MMVQGLALRCRQAASRLVFIRQRVTLDKASEDMAREAHRWAICNLGLLSLSFM